VFSVLVFKYVRVKARVSIRVKFSNKHQIKLFRLRCCYLSDRKGKARIRLRVVGLS
jgi:hypothetical protein